MFEVIFVIPDDGIKAVSPNTVIEIGFNGIAKNIDGSNLYLTKKSKKKKIPASIIKTSDNIWKIIPQNPLSLNTFYTIHATEDIINEFDENLIPFEATFRTRYDNLEPIVIKTFPENAQGSVKVNTCLEFIFSEPVSNINSDTCYLRRMIGNFESPHNIPGQIKQITETSWKFIPSTNLQTNTVYKFHLLSDIVDDLGNGIEETLVTFTTEKNITPPKIIETYPSQGQIGVPVDFVFTIIFNEEVFNTTNENITLKKDGSELSTSINVVKLGPEQIQIIPDQNLEYNSKYIINIKNLKDSAGNPVSSEQISFYTKVNENPPEIISTIPSNGSTSVNLSDSMLVSFSEPVYGVNSSSLYLEDSDSNIVPAQIIFINSNNFKIKPDIPLNSLTTYTLVASQSIVDDTGDALSYPSLITFTTEYSLEPPEVVNISPYPNSQDIPIDTIIEFTFNKPVYNVHSNTFLVKKGDIQVNGVLSQDGNKWVFTPIEPFEKDTEYRVILRKDIIDESGRNLKKTINFSFVTEFFEDIGIKNLEYYTTDINSKSEISNRTANIPTDAKFLLNFTKPIVNPVNHIEVNPGPFSINNLDNQSFEIQAPLIPNEDYIITVDKDIKDERNISLGQFKTYYISTRQVPNPQASSTLVAIDNSHCYLFGGTMKNNNTPIGVLDFQNQNWENTSFSNSFTNTKNAFSIYMPAENKIYFAGGLSNLFQKTSLWSLDLNSNIWTEEILAENCPNIIDWAGKIKVYNNTTSSFEEYLAVISFYQDKTEVKVLDANSNTWELIEKSSTSLDITQAYGSFVWSKDSTIFDPFSLYILGGMSHKNNNLPVKKLQKVDFTLNSGQLEYTVSDLAQENHIIFKSLLAFSNGLRTNRVGNNPLYRGPHNNNLAASLRCENVFSFSSGIFEKESNIFINPNDLKSNILLPFFVNPPDGVIKPFIQLYETNNGAIRFTLPKVDFEYPYINRTEYSIAPLQTNSQGLADSIVIFGGKDEQSNHLNSTWVITPSTDTNENFKFNFVKIAPLFTD